MGSESSRLECSIAGRVQGVGFRMYTNRTADELAGVTGWARNEEDGTVTVVAEGPRSALETFRTRLQEGPRLARVDSLETEWTEPREEYSDFQIRY